MALTKVNRGGLNTGISDSSNAPFLTATSSEGVTLAGTLAVTGVHTVGTNAVATSEGGAATTNIVQGLAKAWIKFNGQNTIAITDSYSVTSIADNGTGQYTVTVSSAFGNANYNFVGATNGDGTNGAATYKDSGVTATTTAIRIRTKLLGNQDQDRSEICVSFFGDLA